MQLVHLIQSKIGKLNEEKFKLRLAINIEPASSREFSRLLKEIQKANSKIAILNEILAEATAPEIEPAKKVEPLKSFKTDRTPKEDKQFFDGLIYDIFRKHHFERTQNASGGSDTLNMYATLDSLYQLNGYMVSLSSLMWVCGFVERLEEMERAPLELIDREELLSKALKDYHKFAESLSDNCNLLQTELNISNGD